MRMEERIRATVLAKDARVPFWPDQFVAAGLGSPEEVRDELLALAGDGKLDPRVQVRSECGELCWEGTPRDLASLQVFVCSECGELINRPREHATVYFRVTAEWGGTIGAAGSKKKSLSQVKN